MFHNLGFLLSLPFLKPAKVVLGLAPWHWSLVLLLPFLRRHQVYYFTSYICWDGSRQVHRGGPLAKAAWREFLMHCTTHVFAVSERSKSELVRCGWAAASDVTVVGHSYITQPGPSPSRPKENRFIVVGDLKPIKGIGEILACFASRPGAELTVIGRGEQEALVKEAAAVCPNIRFAGYISDQEALFREYMAHSFLILNCKRIGPSEELFGMVLIEASACGLVPLAADHSGPREILRDGAAGVVFKEGELASAVDTCMGWSDGKYQAVRSSAIENGRRFYVENVAERWKKVLE